MADKLVQLTGDIDALSGVPDHRLNDEQDKVWKKMDDVLKELKAEPNVLQSLPEETILKVFQFLVFLYQARKQLRRKIVEKVNMLLQCKHCADVAVKHEGLGLLEMDGLDGKAKIRLERTCSEDIQETDSMVPSCLDDAEDSDLKGLLIRGFDRMEIFNWTFPPDDGRHADRDSAMYGFTCVEKVVKTLEASVVTWSTSDKEHLVKEVVSEVPESSWRGIFLFLVIMHQERPAHRTRVEFVVKKLFQLIPPFQDAVVAEPPYFWETAGDEYMAMMMQQKLDAELEVRLRTSDVADDMSVPRFQWMWGDAGLLGLHSVAKLNSLRWSKLRPASALAARLEEWVARKRSIREPRPVEIAEEGSGTTRMFSDYKEAVKWLREDAKLRW